VTNIFSLGKAIKKDTRSSKTSTEVKKPNGVKIKTEVEPQKPKVNIIPFKKNLNHPFDFDSEFNLISPSFLFFILLLSFSG
jgi:hypothetical protein